VPTPKGKGTLGTEEDLGRLYGVSTLFVCAAYWRGTGT
jgi:hypothetical protein